MKLFTPLLAALLSLQAFAQTNPNATGKRVWQGPISDENAVYAKYQTFVIPADQQQGIYLNATGDNSASFGGVTGAALPWFMRINRPTFYVLSKLADATGPIGYAQASNPVIAYGEAGGGTPLYTDREYRFGMYAGARSLTRAGSFRIRAYQKSQFSGTGVNEAAYDSRTFSVPFPGDSNWQNYINAGWKHVEPVFRGLKVTAEVLYGEDWQIWQSNETPYVLTLSGGNPDYYFVIDCKGWATPDFPLAATGLPAAAGNQEFRPVFSVDFTARPTWRSAWIDSPHYTGKAVPSDYSGLSERELSGLGGYSPPVPGAAYETATELDQSPELRQHPKLDKLAADLGNDPVAIANYVHNEIRLVDPLAYSEDQQADPSGVWAGGMDRNAFNTYLEGAGNPWEQCSLLVYLMRKAGFAAVIVEPSGDSQFLLDTQLEKILRMRIKEAVDSAGDLRMPEQVAVHYPWVAVHVPDDANPESKKWVHLFPWMKDTSVIEGGNLYEKFPDDCKSGGAWVRKYLKADPKVMEELTPAHLVNAAGNILIEGERYQDSVAGGEALHNTSAGIDRWHKKTDTGTTGYLGDSWMQALGEPTVPEYTTATKSPKLEYVVDLPSGGDWYVWIRAFAGHSQRRCFVAVDGLAYQTYQLASGSGWQWGNRNPSNQVIKFSVTGAGRHTLRIAAAHAGFGLDRVLLTKSSTFTPSGDGGNLSLASAVGPNTPSHHFTRFADQKLAPHGLGLSDIGMRYLDRKLNRSSLDEFPRPYRLDAAAHGIFTKLSDRPGTFNTVQVSVVKDPMAGTNFTAPNVRVDTGEWLAMDVQNRPFHINVRKTGDRQFKLMATLAPFRETAVGTEDFVSGDKARMQRQEATFDYLPDNGATSGVMDNKSQYTTEIVHIRQRRAIRGSIERAKVTNGGTGYTSAPVVTIAPPPGHETNPTYRTAVAEAIVSGGKVTRIQIVDPGHGYDFDAAAPSLTLSGGGGTGAIANAETPSRWFRADGTERHPLGVDSAPKVISRPSIDEGDLGALCLSFGGVSQRVVDHLAEDFWSYEKRMKANGAEADDVEFREAVQARSSYLAGMEYYRRINDFAAWNADLHKYRMLSIYGAGFSKLQAQRQTYWHGAVGSGIQYKDALPADGDFHHDKPGVDMFFLECAATASESVHSDAGFKNGTNHVRDMWELLITEVSAQEHQVINDYYKEEGAISTVRLLQSAQLNQNRVTPATGVIQLTKANLADRRDDVFVRGTVSRALENWHPGLWTRIEDEVTGEEGDFTEVFITPGNVTSPSLSYNGMGAMIFGKSMWGALIGGNVGIHNGGYGSSFSVPRFTTTYLSSNTLTLGSTGYSLGFGSTSSSSVSLISQAASLWQIPTTYAGLSSGSSVASSYQSFAWSQQATSYGVGGGLASNYYTSQSRGSIGSTSFFGALGNSIGSIGSAIGTMVSQIGGFVSDPVDVVNGDFYLDATDLTLPGPMPLTLRRNYSSLSVADGEFGHGWKSSLVPFIGVGDNGILYAAETDGSVIAYKQSATDANLFAPTTADNPSLKNLNAEGAGGYSNPMNNRIVKSVDGGTTRYTLTGADGGIRRYRVREFPIGSGAERISRERPYVESWTDPQGNVLSFTFYETAAESNYGKLARITASNGNSLGFNYDVSGHVVEAWTQDGRRVSYQYDLQGDLKKVTLPDGAEHRYDYEEEVTVVGGETVRTSKHLLTRETKPGGRILENDYDSQRRVTKQRAVVGTTAQPVQNAEFVYANTQNADKTWNGTTTVKDAYGRDTVFSYTNSLITSEDDPETPAETRTWYAANETGGGAYPRSLRSITDRRGVVKFFKYDSRGNVVEKSLGTDAFPADIDGDGVASAGEKSVTSWTYNDKNLPDTQSEPSGIVTRWFYDDPLFPYLASRTETWSGATLLSKTRREFTQQSAGGKFAKGMIRLEKVAEGTPDEAVIEWQHDERGFATRKTSYTGTGDPDVIVSFKHNLRGELVEEKQLSANGAPERTWSHAYDGIGRKTVSTRKSGALTAIEQIHYTLNGEVEWTDGPRTGVSDRVHHRYDKHGRLTEKLQWLSGPKNDGSGVVDYTGDNAVATTFYSYDLFNNLTEIRTPRRHSIALEYDTIGRTKKVDFYSGYKGQGGVIKATRQYLYEPGGEISQETDELGGVTKVFYNARGQLRRRENPDGSVEQWRFYSDGRPFREYLRNGSYKELTYDDVNRTVTEVLKTSGGTVVKTAVSVHDRRGNLVRETKGGYTTDTTYDALDRVKSVVSPPATGDTERRSDTYAYPDPHGRLTVVINALGDMTTTRRDALDRVVSVERRNSAGTLASAVSHDYSADHNKVTTTNGTGADAIVTERWTDTLGNPVVERRADGTYMMVAYEMGEVAGRYRDHAGKFTDVAHDWQGVPSTEVRPGNLTIVYENDAAGNMLERRMPGSQTEKVEYDSAGRIKLSKLVHGSATTRQITYLYYEPGHVWAGMLKSSTDARGIVTTRTYDDHLRLASVTSDGPDPEDDLSRTFTYDELDHLTAVTETGINGTTTVSRPANDAGRIRSETVSVGGTTQSSVIQKFDGADRRMSRTVADFTQSFVYRADGLLDSTAVGGKVFDPEFNTAGLLTGASGPYQSLVHTRDSLGRITDRKIDAGGAQALREQIPASGSSPGWSAVGKINRMNLIRTGAANEFREFQYDNSDRLIAEAYPEKAVVSQNDIVIYTYDNLGFNATGGLGSLTTRYRINAGREQYHKASNVPVSGDFARITLNQYQGMAREVPLTGIAFGAHSVRLQLDGRAVAPVNHPGWQDATGAWNASATLPGGSYTLTATAVHPSGQTSSPATSTFTVAPRTENVTTAYDEEGNVRTKTWTGGVVQTYTWDARNRLVKVVQTGVRPSVWTALYDGFDRRIRTTFTPQGGETVTVRSVYDPEVEFLEIGQGVSIGAGTTGWSWKAYSVDLSGGFGGLEGLGGLEAVRDAKGQWRGIVNDWWGNVSGWIERPGDAVTWSGRQFGAWGNVTGYNTAVQDGKSPIHQLLGYRGLTIDPPGFMQMGLRPYDMLAGAWLSCDPLGHDGSLSLYDYCDNDPVNRADPDGRFGKAVGSMAYSAGSYAWNKASVGVVSYLTGHTGSTAGMSAGQIWSSYRNSYVGMVHAQQWDSALNWVPVVNVAKWSVQGISGRNFITGADLSVGQQIGSVFSVGVSVLPAPIMAWSSSATAIGAGSTFSNPNVIKGGFQAASKPWGAPTPSVGTMNTGGTMTLSYRMPSVAPQPTHKNSLSYVGESHVYSIKAPDGSVYKIGKSSVGTNAGGQSIRAESQVRRLNRIDIANGGVGGYESRILKTFDSAAASLKYESSVRDRYRRMFGQDLLPGNRERLRTAR